jgi:DNA helicase-2/ATP-dependent DNA helicase PcrA
MTDEQLQAATAPPTPSVVIAGAGSGKTTVMAARVLWLVGSGQAEADSVLGLTFTNKAAGELAERVRLLLDLLGPPAGADDSGLPTVATYHSYAARLLRDHGIRLGIEPHARLLTDAGRYQLAEQVLRRARGPFECLSTHLPTTTTYLLALDAELNEHLVDPGTAVAACDDLIARIDGVAKSTAKIRELRAATARRRELLGLVTDLRRAKQSRDLVDFGDQMAAAAKLARDHPDVARAESAQYRVVLLDEYQDTSVTQKELMRGLFGGGHPVTAVGDPCQAIYGWRGASVRNLGRFQEEFPDVDGRPARRFNLTQNNRSGGRLLDLANEMSQQLRSRHDVLELAPRREVADQGDIRCALLNSYADEVAWVTEQVVQEIAAGTNPRDIAVLVRRRSEFAAYFDAFSAAGVPVEVVGLGGLLSLPEVAEVVATLRVIDEPTANADLVRLLSGPRWRVGPRDLVLLGRRAAQLARPVDVGESGDAAEVGERDPESGATPDPDPLADAVAGVDPVDVVALSEALADPGRGPYSEAAMQRFAALSEELRGLRRHASEPLLDLVHRVVAALGLDVEMSATPQAVSTQRSAGLAAFTDVVSQFADIDNRTGIRPFLAYLDAAVDQEHGLDTTAPSESDTVKVMTVHKAKGLEWDVVVLPALADRVFPDPKGRASWLTQAQVLPFALRGDSDDFPAEPGLNNKEIEAFGAEMKQLSRVEEDRLGYVAVTRPKRRLIASAHWWGPDQVKHRGPSAFLTMIREHLRTRGIEPDTWADPPQDDAVNPSREQAQKTAQWPPPADPAAEAARRAGAELVRSAQRGEIAKADVLSTELAQRVAGWDADLDVLVAEAMAAHEPVREVVLPRSLSASRLVAVAADPQALARQLYRPMPRRPAPAARRGTRFHAWVESLFGEQPLLDFDDVGGAADEYLSDTEMAALQQSFLAGPFGERRPHGIEIPFRWMLGDHVIAGRIDAVYAEPSAGHEVPRGASTPDGVKWLVVDFKTGRSTADPLQLAIYRAAWAEIAGVPLGAVDAAFYYVASGDVVHPPELPGPDRLRELLADQLAQSPSVE